MGDERITQVIGVVADTHVPDRVNALHPDLISQLRAAQVDEILHMGDVSVNRVLDELGQVAPVSVVRGNRDWLITPPPPWMRRVTFCGVPVLLAHGQGGFFNYWFDKVIYVLIGYRFEHYRRRLWHSAPDARVYVFGHTHHPANRFVDGRLYFNPGSASANFAADYATPSFGLLRFSADGQVQGEICPLLGWRARRGQWRPVKEDRR